MAGGEETLRRILREGDEIGDHTMHHVEDPGYAEITVSELLGHRMLYRPYG
jgi:hypothetical protein